MRQRAHIVAIVIAAACGGTYDVSDDAGRVHVPEGWTALAIVPDAMACPASFSDARELVEGAHSKSPSCACSCGEPATSPCSYGLLSAYGRANASDNACSKAPSEIPADGSCSPRSSGDVPTALRGTAVPVRTVSCPATSELPPVDVDAVLTVCTSAPPTACTDGLCITPPADARLCVLRDGESTCPAGWPVRRLVISRASIRDRRVCGTCECSSRATTCDEAKLTYYADAECTLGAREVALDGRCHSLPASTGGAPTHRRYSSTPNPPGCAPSAATVPVMGTIDVDEQTLCCK